MLNDQKISADTTGTPVIDVCHQELDVDSSQSDDLQHVIRWRWPEMLIAQVQSTSLDVSNDVDTPLLIFVSPTTYGLDALEKSELSIKSLWVLHLSGDGMSNLHGFHIKEISSWPVAGDDDLPQTVLHTTDNKLFGIGNNQFFNFQKSSTLWNGSGPFKRPTDEEIE